MVSANGPADLSYDQDALPHIQNALQASYDSNTTSAIRQQALQYLEGLMSTHEAPKHGFSLASDVTQPPHARHFGLTLIEQALLRRWSQYSGEESEAIRQWVLDLGHGMRPDDPAYLRNKMATLWVVLAERTWGDTWMDMDAMLHRLWDVAVSDARFRCNKAFVLYILECLSEDICVRENPVAMLRQEALGHAFNQVMIPPQLYGKQQDEGDESAELRQSGDGWLLTICRLLVTMSSSRPGMPAEVAEDIAVKCLGALKPTMSWISLDAVLESECIDCVYHMLADDSSSVKLASVELLLAIYSRPYSAHFMESWAKLIRAAISTERIDLMRQTFSSATTDPDDIDETNYTLQKKLSEVLAALGTNLARIPTLFESETQLRSFYDLSTIVFQSDSLLVSIPVLHSLVDAITTRESEIRRMLQQADSILMDTCLLRLIRFESLPQDTPHPILKFLREDFETLPELHAFLGNYRRYCVKVIETIATGRPVEAIRYLLEQMRDVFDKVDPLRGSGDGVRIGNSKPSYTKNDISIVQLEASYVAIKAALGGYSRWMIGKRHRLAPGKQDPSAQQEIISSMDSLAESCQTLISIGLRIDPTTMTSTLAPNRSLQADIARLCSKTLVELLLRLHSPPDAFVVAAFIAIMQVEVRSTNDDLFYNEAVKLFEAERMTEIQRMAMCLPNQLYGSKDQVYRSIERLLENNHLDNKLRWGCKGIPVSLIQRSVRLDEESRLSQLRSILEPVALAWTLPDISRGAASFENFCELLGLSQVPEYVEKRGFDKIHDWSAVQLDEDGRYLQNFINARLDALPLRMTQALLSASSEGVKEGTPPQRIAAAIWSQLVPSILPNVLALLQYSTSFAADRHWGSLSSSTRGVLRKMLIDRFWQSGISAISKDDFQAKVSASSETYEGFASTVRGSPRQARDGCYHIIHNLTRFPDVFYSIPDLGIPLATALAGDADCLSIHQLQRFVVLVDRLVERCPPQQRRAILLPLISTAFEKLRIKLTQEWEALESMRSLELDVDSEKLAEEMKADSLVRPTTYAVVQLAYKLIVTSLDRSRETGPADGNDLATLMRSEKSTAIPIVAFAVDALRMRDSRSVTIVCQILRSISKTVPTLQTYYEANKERYGDELATLGSIREHLETAALQAAITSINEHHFVDVQRDLAVLIGSIISYLAPSSPRVAQVLVSFAGLDPKRVERAIEQIMTRKRESHHAYIVLELLDGIKGVHVSELGKIGIGGNKTAQKKKVSKWAGAQEMDTEPTGIIRGNTPPEGGLGAMFGEA